MNADTAAALRLHGVDPERLVDRRRHRPVVVDIAARRRQLVDQAAADYVLAERHVVSADPFVDDLLEQAHVRLQHDHPAFFARNRPVGRAPMIAVLAVSNATVAAWAAFLWIVALLAAIAFFCAVAFTRRRHQAPPHLAQQLQADQRRHVARWANHEGDDDA